MICVLQIYVMCVWAYFLLRICLIPLSIFITILSKWKVIRSCLTLWPHGLQCPWNSLGQNTGFPSSGDLPNPGIELGSLTFPADSLPTELSGKPITVLHGFNSFSFIRNLRAFMHTSSLATFFRGRFSFPTSWEKKAVCEVFNFALLVPHCWYQNIFFHLQNPQLLWCWYHLTLSFSALPQCPPNFLSFLIIYWSLGLLH